MKVQNVVFAVALAANAVYAGAQSTTTQEAEFPKSLGVGLDTPLMNSMLYNSTSFDNELNILNAKSRLKDFTVYFGGYAQGGFNYAQANKPTFFYSDNATYEARGYFSLDRTALVLMPNINSWSTVYLEAGATDLGQSYASPIGVNQLYLLLGDGTFPLYGFAGYKNIDFGNFSTVNIFAQPITRWDYAGTALTAGAGYAYDDFNITLSALRGGTQGAEDYYGAGLWRVHNYPNYYTDGARNYAINASYGPRNNKNINWKVGAGYIRGLWLGNPVNFFNNETIGAWDVNAQVYSKHITVLGEYVQSTPKVSSYGSFVPINPEGVYLRSWDFGASYKWDNCLLPHESAISADVSGVIGNTAFASATQYVLGISNQVKKNLKAGVEYVYLTQDSSQGANRSGAFYRAYNDLQVLRLDLVASF